MKNLISILFFSVNLTIYSQTALQNNGNLQLHNNAQIGFHTNLINEGTITNDNNYNSFAGFYSNNQTLTVSGTNRPVFYNVDIVTTNSYLQLKTSLAVTNDLNFVEGKVLTDKNDTSISLDFIAHDFYGGQNDNRHVDGYASVENYNDEFSFPIGDDDRLREMILPKQTANNLYKGAYFFEDPNIPTTFTNVFDTDKKEASIKTISNQEFWDLDGNTQTTITLTWDAQSNIPFMAKDLKNLRVVGWNKTTNEWEDLGNTQVTGNEDKGKITSNLFLPDAYEVITIGAIESIDEETPCNANYLISPNGDGIGDSLTIDCLKNYPNKSELSVYNRWGILVFKAKNYKDNWQGISNGRSTIAAKDGLPVGTYFYILKYGKSLNQTLKGWVYINR